MYENNHSASQGKAIVRALLSRTSFLTLTIASALLTLFILFNTLASAFSSQKNNLLASLYYFFGESSVMAVNLIVGILIFLLFVFITLGMLTSYLGATKNDDAKMLQGINLMLGSLIYMVILSICITIISLSSISVTYYQTISLTDADNYSDYIQNNTSYASSAYNFFIYALFASGIITLSIALIRVVLSIRRAANEVNLTSKGVGLSLVSGIYCASIVGISFIVNLCNLIMPYEYINNKMPEPATLLLLMISVFISAAMTVILIDLSMLISIYSSNVNRINKSYARDIYVQYSTNLYNQNQNRTPYTNPVQNIPSPPAQPYTAQTHQKYMNSINNNVPQQSNDISSSTTVIDEDKNSNE